MAVSVNNNNVSDNKSSHATFSVESIKEYNGRTIKEFQNCKKNPDSDSCDKTFRIIATAKIYEKNAWKNIETLEPLSKEISTFQTPKGFQASLRRLRDQEGHTSPISVILKNDQKQGKESDQPRTYDVIIDSFDCYGCLVVNQYLLHPKKAEIARIATVALLFQDMCPRVLNYSSFLIGNGPVSGDHSEALKNIKLGNKTSSKESSTKEEVRGMYVDFKFTQTKELDKGDVVANGLSVEMTNCKNISEVEQSLGIVGPSNESVILVRCDVGFDAQLGIRGQGGDLTWHENKVLKKISQNLWAFPTNIDLSKVEAKFVRIPAHGDIAWEKIPNGQNRKFTSATIQTCLPTIDGCHSISEGKQETGPTKQFIFKFNAKDCENLVVRGEIGNWNQPFPLKNLGNGIWFLELPLSNDKKQIQIKILNGDNWEKGENRVLILDAQQEIIPLKDPVF